MKKLNGTDPSSGKPEEPIYTETESMENRDILVFRQLHPWETVIF